MAPAAFKATVPSLLARKDEAFAFWSMNQVEHAKEQTDKQGKQLGSRMWRPQTVASDKLEVDSENRLVDLTIRISAISGSRTAAVWLHHQTPRLQLAGFCNV